MASYRWKICPGGHSPCELPLLFFSSTCGFCWGLCSGLTVSVILQFKRWCLWLVVRNPYHQSTTSGRSRYVPFPPVHSHSLIHFRFCLSAGMHTIKDRAVVVNGEIVIRPIMVVALTYDHRLLDGREAVTFLGAFSLAFLLWGVSTLLFLLLHSENTDKLIYSTIVVRVKEYLEDPRKMLLA
jgi:hypothetical protein